MNGSRERASLIVVMLVDAAGAPNDGFLPNSLVTHFRLSRVFFRPLEMHSKRRYKICICSVILCGGTWVFPKLQGLQYYFSEKFRCNLAHYEKEKFFDSSLHHIFESENLRFPFSYEKWSNLGCEVEKIKLHKIAGNLLDKLRKLTAIERSPRNFQASSSNRRF